MSTLKVVLAVGSDLEVRADQHGQVEPGKPKPVKTSLPTVKLAGLRRQ